MSMRYLAGYVSAFYDPLRVPNAPTIGAASVNGATSISVTFTAPVNVGGGAITGYIATAKKISDGTTISANGTTSPIAISGLETDVAYTATVLAINAFGSSSYSSASNSIAPGLTIGGALGGGYYAGQISTTGNGVATHYLVVGPVATAQAVRQWNTSNTNTPGTASIIDGPANTDAMNNATHPAAFFCKGLSIGGFTDWYMPATNELEICYYNLKPTTTDNVTGTGINVNAVPARASNYTLTIPAQTIATDFRSTGTEFFSSAYYWASTQATSGSGALKFFVNGALSEASKSNNYRVRAVRRIPV